MPDKTIHRSKANKQPSKRLESLRLLQKDMSINSTTLSGLSKSPSSSETLSCCSTDVHRTVPFAFIVAALSPPVQPSALTTDIGTLVPHKKAGAIRLDPLPRNISIFRSNSFRHTRDSVLETSKSRYTLDCLRRNESRVAKWCSTVDRSQADSDFILPGPVPRMLLAHALESTIQSWRYR